MLEACLQHAIKRANRLRLATEWPGHREGTLQAQTEQAANTEKVRPIELRPPAIFCIRTPTCLLSKLLTWVDLAGWHQSGQR